MLRKNHAIALLAGVALVAAGPADERKPGGAAIHERGRNAHLRQAGEACRASQPHHTGAKRVEFSLG